MEKIRFRIIGTSNGVLSNGYAAFLSKMSCVEVVQNLSIGSSHSSLLPGAVEQFDQQQSDICILDLAVNEQRALCRGLYSFETTKDIFDYFLGVCEKHNMVPVVLLLPLLTGPNPSNDAIRLWTKLCIDRGVVFIDALAVASREWPNMDVRSLWRDAAHPDEAASERIALEIYKRSSKCLLERTFPTPNNSRDFICYREIKGNLVSRSTRVTSRELFVLEEGDRQVIDVGGPARVVGLSLNMAKTNGALEISGDNCVVKSLANGFYESRDFWFVSWNLVSPVTSNSGIFKLAVLRVEDGMNFEDNDHRARQLPPPDELLQIELESLIIERL